jgi:hypothetical protein
MKHPVNPVFTALKRERGKFIACALLIITGVTGSTLSPLFQKDLVDLLKNGAGAGTFFAARRASSNCPWHREE